MISSRSLSDTSFVVRNVFSDSLDMSEGVVWLGASNHPVLPSSIPVLANAAELTIHVGASTTDNASNVHDMR